MGNTCNGYEYKSRSNQNQNQYFNYREKLIPLLYLWSKILLRNPCF